MKYSGVLSGVLQVVGMLLASGHMLPAQAQAATASGVAYISLQHPEWPPLPANVSGVPETQLGDGRIALNDLNYDYDLAAEVARLWGILNT
jgi:hypothetical protein